MLSLDRSSVERYLLQLEDSGFFSPLTLCKSVDNNKQLNLIGVGGTSYVYELCDTQIKNRYYALKIMGNTGEQIDIEDVVVSSQSQYFLNEQSENIVRIIALWIVKILVDEDNNILSVVNMDDPTFNDVEGLSIQMVLMERLDNILEKDKFGSVSIVGDRLKDEKSIIDFAVQIGETISIIHNNGFLHRDIKLENIFWDSDTEKYKLGDFGTVRHVDNGNAETILFTNGYGAPEIEKRLQDFYNKTADIYSFGITLYLLFNDLKFPGSDSYRASFIQYEENFIVPAPAHASEKMTRIIRKMCSFYPEDRYQSMEEVLSDIKQLSDFSFQEKNNEEYDDIETEIYCDDEVLDESVHKFEGPLNNEKEFVKSFDKEMYLTRKDIFELKKSAQEDYYYSTFWRFMLIIIMSFYVFKAFYGGNGHIDERLLMIIPVLFFIESIFQTIKELHIEFGVFVIGLMILLLFSNGINSLYIVGIVICVLGLPIVSAGCAIGAILWLMQCNGLKFFIIPFLNNFSLGWFAVIGFVGIIEDYLYLRVDYTGNESDGEKVISLIEDFSIILLFVGIVILIINFISKKDILILDQKIPFVRIGLGIYLVHFFNMYRYDLLDLDIEEENDSDEPVDK
ncbi:protein kinase [Kandleria sp.]|uniref:protein kinase domain-containing protein n=1 Tax=Kandleria sp. TaxID=2774291 RepID=UPI001B7A1974|nr:protein kinase [Kandleria sp.]MBP3276611.1 protein kinase [Kandleria sp.]